MEDEKKPFRVLSIDGGGMRGVYAIAFLDALAKKTGHNRSLDVGRCFDLIAGTSTGGIIAAGLAAGKSTSEILGFYKEHGEKIFTDPTPPSTEKCSFYRWLFRNAGSSANNNGALIEALEEVFSGENLEELYDRRGIALCVPAIAMSNHSCSVFKTPHHPEGKLTRDNKLKISDVCLATSAAPIILPVASINDPQKEVESSYVDGGLCANNPTLIALTEALLLADGRPIEIISIGTCPPAPGSVIKKDDLKKGLLGWGGGTKALEASMDAQAGLVNDTARLLIDRLNIQAELIRPIPSSIPCDLVDVIGLDRASPEALTGLINLAHFDADKFRGASFQQENPKIKKLIAIFENMPQMEK